MKGLNHKQSIFGSFLALIIATSCCWLPWLIIVLGGAAGFVGFAEGLEKYSGVFMLLAGGLLALGLYQYLGKNKNTSSLILKSTITCPKCGTRKRNKMPIDACQYFYECQRCKEISKPLEGDCCVYCSYGTVPCPPIQENKNCC